MLIDEAQTALIITAPSEDEEDGAVSKAVLAFARTLREGTHSTVLLERRTVRLSPAADRIVDAFAPPSDALIAIAARRERLIQALSAIHHHRRDERYIVTEDEDGRQRAALVDEFTGRIMADRQWQRDLYQMSDGRRRSRIPRRARRWRRLPTRQSLRATLGLPE